jgi:hypothetical protein
VNLKIGQIKLFSLRSRKKKRSRKGTEPKKPVGHHQAYQYMHHESLGEKKENN